MRNGDVRNTLEVTDSTFRNWAALNDGWAWVSEIGDRIVIERGGKRHEIPKPGWAANFTNFDVSPDGSRLVYTAWNASTEDTLRVETVPLEGGTPVPWGESFAETGGARWLADGSVMFAVWLTSDAVTLRRFEAPGQARTLGTIPHVARMISYSDDLKRATLGWRDYRGDAWLYRVVKPN